MLRQRLAVRISATLIATTLALGAAPAAQAHDRHAHDASAASALSLLMPVAVSVAVPATFLSAGAAFTVVAVEASAIGTVWVVERASDGMRASFHFAAHAGEASLVAVGSAITVTALSAGWVLSVAGEVLVFIPNEIGRALMHNERLTY
jgi:hypothetical protein